MGARLLVICTANICRSPAAERLLASRLGPSVQVVSRGVRAYSGAPMCAASANWVLMNGGGSGDGHLSEPLALADVRAATLILTATRKHRAEVLKLRPSAQVRTFTLAQAARIASWRMDRGGRPEGDHPAERLLWLGEQLDGNRGRAPAGNEADDDLPDPHSGAAHAEVFARLTSVVDDICAPLLDRAAT